MNPDEHFEAFKFLHAEFLPNEKAIDAMSESQVDECLAAEGIDITKLNERIAERKKKLAGQFALQAARQRRLAAKDDEQAAIAVPPTAEKIMELLKATFGEELPLAAQKAAGKMTYEELSQLYRDLMSGPRKSPDAI